MYFNHSLAGALVVKPIIDKVESKFTKKELTVLWFVGITSSVLPDFDLAYSVLRNLDDHRSFVTHGIFLYLIMFALLYLISRFQKKDVFGRKFLKTMAFVFLYGVSIHLLIDFFLGGISLFAPFSYNIVGFDMRFRGVHDNWLLAYVTSPYMILEFFIAFLFFRIIKGEKYFFARVYSLFYFIVAILSFVSVNIFFF